MAAAMEMTTDNDDNNVEIVEVFGEKRIILIEKAGQNPSGYTKGLYSFQSIKKWASQGQGGYIEVYIAVGRAEQAGQGLSGYTEAYTASKSACIDSKMRLRY